MIKFEIKVIKYLSVMLGTNVKHYVLLAEHKGKTTLISIPNLYLYNKSRSSLQTSKRYATLLAQFYRFLSTQKRFKSLEPGDYHIHATNTELRQWQIYRQVNRVNKASPHPTSETIFNDACVVLYFFKWLFDEGIPTSVKISLKTWTANFKDRRMLSYIAKKTRFALDSNPIRVLDKQSRQKKAVHLIKHSEVKTLLSAYPDKVYATLFKFALATAMRPMELVKFPYMGNGKNRHVLPYSEMDKESKSFSYEVLGKGNKLRDIIIPAYALKLLDDEYIKTEYLARAKLYRERFGHKCPLSTLFLTSEGVPVTQSMISNATNYAKKLAIAKDPSFSVTNIFYHARKWWPTMMMVQHHNGEKILEKNAEVMHLALTQVIMNQMGHEDPITTYNHYLVLARYLIMANKGITHETIHEDALNIHQALEMFG
ncbi:tyrosine-type recombinase/integrase [Pseudomonas sp. NPDC087612]|uniref:tyrosine-type recombinase/integrase n=1 Tax=Pseudomonas sp. NPDC087612 TaxID=3364441 RepID=UPI00382F33F0